MKKEEMMKKFVPVLGVVFFVILFLVGNVYSAFAQEKENQPLKKPCCIAGTYKGIHKDLPSLTCSEPGEGEITMEINQDSDCGSKIWGKITIPSGDVLKFEGTVKPGPGRCCTIEATAELPGESIKFKGILCKKDTKWYSKEGKYVHSRGCKGVFEIKQI
jgi:hypothetical protein